MARPHRAAATRTSAPNRRLGAARWLTAFEAEAAQILRFGADGSAESPPPDMRKSVREQSVFRRRIRRRQPHVAAMNRARAAGARSNGRRERLICSKQCPGNFSLAEVKGTFTIRDPPVAIISAKMPRLAVRRSCSCRSPHSGAEGVWAVRVEPRGRWQPGRRDGRGAHWRSGWRSSPRRPPRLLVLTALLRTSPAANTPGRLASSK
jgi:hypothetical protein